MTRKEILALAAGRALDALVAERVMERRIHFVAAEEVETKEDPSAPLGMTCNFGGAVYTSDREWVVNDWLDVEANRAVRPYSTSIEAAMDVLHKARGEEQGHFIISSITRDGYVCTLGESKTAQGATIAEAICKASLLAVGDRP